MTAFGADPAAADIRSGLPERAERVLVLSPHPDDESIGCGGTLVQLAARGSRIEVMFMTAGTAQREQEARAAARLLGLRDVRFLGGQDGGLNVQTGLVEPFMQLIAWNNYQVIFCPWPRDKHLDHQATFAILRDAVNQSTLTDAELWFYEVWSPLSPNRIVDIGPALATKMAAIACHRSQMREKDYVVLARRMAKTRAKASGLPNVLYAEAFSVCGMGDLANFERRGA